MSLSDVLMMDHQMTEQTPTPLVVTTRLLAEEDVELQLLLVIYVSAIDIIQVNECGVLHQCILHQKKYWHQAYVIKLILNQK